MYMYLSMSLTRKHGDVYVFAFPQGARVLYERESHIVINYSKLDEDLKDVMAILCLLLINIHFCGFPVQLDDDSDIRKMAQELNAKLTRLQSTLQRINAPNMRALEKLVVWSGSDW